MYWPGQSWLTKKKQKKEHEKEHEKEKKWIWNIRELLTEWISVDNEEEQACLYLQWKMASDYIIDSNCLSALLDKRLIH